MKIFYILVFIAFSISASFAQETGGPYTTDENTVLLMHFDGDATNSANIGNNGIAHGSGVTYETGVHGQALRLDNTTADKQSWIEVPFYNGLSFSEEFSIECWFKINSWGDNQTRTPFLLKKGESWPSDYEIQLNEEYSSLSANLNCVDDEFNRGANIGITDIIETGKWYHIAFYFNFSHNHLYLILRDENFNEIYANHRYTYTPAFQSTDKLFIGFGIGGNTYFDGTIDELRISNKYLKHRDNIVSTINISELKESVQPILRDKWKVYQWPFMAYYPRSANTGEIHKGNSCGITAIMRLIHYWEYPRFPIGNIDYNDGEFYWKADFDNTEYRFDEMPYVFGSDPSVEEYDAAATMVAQIGATAKYFGIGAGSAPIKTILERYFKYDKNLKIIYREEYTKEEWETIFKNELSNGRPILIEGTAERYDNGSWAGHYYICDGYNSDNKFHTDLSIGETEWWTDIDNFEYGKNQCALIYAEPDWNGKSLQLSAPVGGEYYKHKAELNIQWTSENISSVDLEYSFDAGKNWVTLAENLNASESSYIWQVPDTISTAYKIRISDSSDGNIYQRCDTFAVYDQKQFAFIYPLASNELKPGTKQSLYWQSTGIKAIKLEYSSGDESWQSINDSLNCASGSVSFLIPDTETGQIIFRATDISDSTISFLSSIVKLNSISKIGELSSADDSTILLMHFEQNLKNEANNNLLPVESLLGSFANNFTSDLGKSYLVNNSPESSTSTYLCINNSENVELGNNWTIESWIKIRSIGDDKTGYYPIIIEKGDVFGILVNHNYVETMNGFHAYLNFENETSITFFQNQSLDFNKWYHVALISDSASQSINFYVHDKDRNLIYEGYQPFPEGTNGELKQNENVITVGGMGGASNRQFDGWLDEILITKHSNLIDYIETVELPFFDDFEESISSNATFTKWTTQNLEGWQYWHMVTGQGVDYSQCMRFENNDTDQDDWLIAQALNCSDYWKLTVNFDVLYNGTGDKPRLFYKSMGGDNNTSSDWTELNYSLGSVENEWYSVEEITINNPGEIIYFAFHSEQAANQGIYFLLDNFRVEGILTGNKLKPTAQNDLKVYPNPVTQQSVISVQTNKFETINLTLFDINGRQLKTIFSGEVTAGTHTFPIGKYLNSNGIFFCKLLTTNYSSTLKIIKND